MYANPDSNDCTTYVDCDYDLVASVKNCPADTLFSPVIRKCYNNYDCNESCSKDPCSSGVGRYVDYKSGRCDSFIDCRDESFSVEVFQPVYEKLYCPPGTYYNPEKYACYRQYTCPVFPVNYCYGQRSQTTTTTTASP